MSTQVWEDGEGEHRLTLTRYYGGWQRGRCFQITGKNDDGRTGHVQMTPVEMQKLIEALQKGLEDIAWYSRSDVPSSE